MADTTITQQFFVKGMSCTSCAISLESRLRSIIGIKNVNVNYTNTSANLSYDTHVVSAKEIQKSSRELGFELVLPEQFNDSLEQNKELSTLKRKLYIAICFGVPVFIISMFLQGALPFENWILLILSTPVVFYSGSEFLINAIKRLRHLNSNMDTLIALSTQIAFWYSIVLTVFPNTMKGAPVYFESAVIIIAFMLIGRFLEFRAKNKASEAIKKLASLQSKHAVTLKDNKEILIPIEQVQLGDLLIIKPGESVTVDGIVISGNSYIDEKLISGEPVPVFKEKGHKVTAGTINKEGKLVIKAEQLGDKTLLSQILKLVQEAQASKVPIQKLVDKIASVFVPIVLLIAVISFVIWYFVFPIEEALQFSIQISIAVLIIACPCALGLATPTALIVGMGRGASNGILIRNGESLETISKTNIIVLDKTGTITIGSPKIETITWTDDNYKQETEAILVALEKQSTHPLAKAISSHFPDTSLVVDDLQNFPGKGISGKVKGENYHAGSLDFMNEFNLNISDKLNKDIYRALDKGNSLVLFGNQKSVLAVIIISDEIKSNAQEVISKIKTLGTKVVMLTGDNEKVAEDVSKKLHFDGFYANVLPTEKGQVVEILQSQGKTVTMVGDGINDTYALAKANVGIAMASGSDIAREHADITLLNSDLAQIPRAIKLSKATLKNIKQNLFFAFAYNIIAIPVATGLLYPFFGILLNPMVAGAAMAMSSVSVVSNSLRLKKVKLD